MIAETSSDEEEAMVGKSSLPIGFQQGNKVSGVLCR
jgi:hypothetical protein